MLPSQICVDFSSYVRNFTHAGGVTARTGESDDQECE